MTGSDTLFFVAKCLTLGCCPERIEAVREIIRSGSVEWEKVVWTSTSEFVFPALYLQLQRAGLLDELPADLVEYMEDVTSLNREHNRQIIAQAHEITAILNKEGLFPIFLKGTAHLLDGLYQDIAERMVGDIDFLVDEKVMERAAELLIATGYRPLLVYNPKDRAVTKHYPRMVHDHRTAAVEIHRQLLVYPSSKVIDINDFILNNRKLDQPGSMFVLCDQHQIIHNILNVQVNDHAYYYGSLYLRQSYDLLLLSQRDNPLKVVKDFGKYFHLMNGNLAINSIAQDHPGYITCEPDWQSRLFIRRVKRNINHPRWERFSFSIGYFGIWISNYVRVLVRSTYDKDTRSSLFVRLINPKWYAYHFRRFHEEF